MPAPTILMDTVLPTAIILGQLLGQQSGARVRCFIADYFFMPGGMNIARKNSASDPPLADHLALG